MEKRLTADMNVIANSNLEIQLLDGDLNVIQKLDDEPNDVGGLTSAELKAKFDESGNIIKKYINETLIPAVLAEDATEESRKQAEAARVAAEQGRVTAEEGRVSAEAERAAAEQARSESESSRASAENTRAQAETARASAEASRSQDEAARNSAESTRQANETARQNAESARQTAETNRAQTETARNVWEDYDSAKNYQHGNKVYWQGSSYVCLKPCSGISPENGLYWQLVVRSGFTSDSAFGFDVVNGRLLCYYSGDNPPPFRLGDDGHLYVDLDKTYDLGKVTGGSGSGSGVDIDLGITGAQVGQIAKITAVDDTGKPTAWSPVDMPSGGTFDHTMLKNRNADDQHPMSAITGLTDALAGKQPTGNYMTQADLQDATDKALAQAKASGEFDGADGQPGKNGVTPTIGDNGNWYLGTVDTGKPSRGEKGAGAEVYYIDLTDKYPNYTCTTTMADIAAAYTAGLELKCRCTIDNYTAVLPLFVPIPSMNTWVFSGSGALDAIGFPAHSLTIAIANGEVMAHDTRLATTNDIPIYLPNPYALIIKTSNETVTYNGSEVKTVEIAGGNVSMRINNGYIQYSTDNGANWESLIALTDLKGAPGKNGADGVTPHIGDNGNWYIGNSNTGKPSRGVTGPNGADGKTPVRGTDYWTNADKQEIINSVIAALPDGTEVSY